MKRWPLALCAFTLVSCGAVDPPPPSEGKDSVAFERATSLDPMPEVIGPSMSTPEAPAASSAADVAAPSPPGSGRALELEAAPKLQFVPREGMPRGFNMVPPGYGVRMEASSWEELVKRSKPTFFLDDWEMLWVERDDGGRLQFVIDRACVILPEDVEPRWVLLTGPGGWLSYANRSVSPLRESRPVSDTGPGDYALVTSRGPDGQTLYEVGRQYGPCGIGWVMSIRLFYLLNDREGNWRFIGEGPQEGRSGMGQQRGSHDAVRETVHWTGQEDAPVRVEFVCSHTECYPSKDQAGLPRNTVYRDFVLEGEPPATLQRGDRWYALTKGGETLDDVVYRQAVWSSCWSLGAFWSSGWSSRKGQQNAALAVWRDGILRQNPGLDPAKLREGTRIKLPTRSEITDASQLARRNEVARSHEVQ